MFRCSFLAAVGLLLSASALTAQSPNSPPTPAASDPAAPEKMEEVQVGDHWTYEFRDNISGDVKSVLTDTVTDLTDSQIGISITRAGNTSSGYQTYDRSWNLIKSGVHRYSPSDGTGIQAQLATGKAWSIKSNDVNGGFTAKRSVTSKVIAQESVTTPAGTFDTFKIETSIQLQNSNNATDKAQAVIQTWYAPTIDHWVKRDTITRSDGRVRANHTVELVEYGRR
jgi:uncharacterized protein DUF3108